jgi:hypothetical protein
MPTRTPARKLSSRRPAIAGHIIDAHGARDSYAFAACCGVIAVLTCLAGRSRLRTKLLGVAHELA